MSADGLRMLPVVNDVEDVAMAPVICEYEIGAHLHDLPKVEGIEHFLFVIRGAVEIHMEHAEPLVLGPGDCAYVRSQRISEVSNVGDGRAVMIWVSSPPTAHG